MVYRVYDIEWDTDGEVVDLPNEMFLEIDNVMDEDYANDMLSDAISDQSGWCHFGFKYEKAKLDSKTG